ncbi:hypothetical protein K488DRAFT_54870, partial [Vararia minispora EC-137]
EVATSNAPITGFYNVTSSLRLVTSNAPIDVEVEARQLRAHWPADIRLVTSNAELSAQLTLFNTTEHGRFRVFARTSNAASDVSVLASPLGSAHVFDTRTSNAPARLALDASFEGHYLAYSLNAAPVLDRREGVEDPTGSGRERVVETNRQAPGMIGGTVYWGAPKSHGWLSSAVVTTSNKPATFVL